MFGWLEQTRASLPITERWMQHFHSIIIGSEGKGMSRLLKEKCDFLYHLPMRGHVTSLNASVAASLLMYEVLRKRQPINPAK